MRLIVLLLLISQIGFSQNQQMLMGTKVAAAAPFSPTDISNLELWLDGSDVDGDGVQEGTSESTLTGNQVDDWIDKSGNSRNFSRGGSPQLQNISGNLYSVACNGDDNFSSDDAASEWTFFHSDDVTVILRMEIDNLNVGTSYYVISTGASSTSTTGMSLAWSDTGSGSNNWDKDWVTINSNSTSNQPIYDTRNTGDYWTSSNIFYDIIQKTDVDNATSSNRVSLTIDGTLTSQQVDSGEGVAVSTSAPTYSMRLFSLGSSAAYTVGSIAEILIYSRQLTSSEISELETYLSDKY